MSDPSVNASPPEQPAGLELHMQVKPPSLVILYVRGDIDVATAPELERALQDMLTAAQPVARLTVDVSAVSFIGAKGLRALETAAIEANYSGHQFDLSGCSCYLIKLLDLLDMTVLLPVKAA
ncbi:STAS domain-containing protein [Pseudonocardia sp. Cha107L01]|jgi:anti-anti-sigma factor|uniref:STAS domain-containing protein n=1 Tax=Pseudonocardia sp. Cha107L01 TaxID=3457576 RepID=UPI00403EE314